MTAVAHHPGSFRYHANGNLVEENGQKHTWDFKDRMVANEDAATRAEYRYNFADKRVLRKVTPKVPGAESFTTIYPFQDFEVRALEEPVKYVWMGGTRIARVTGSLSNRPRLQRIRLVPGWNLVGLSVAATNAGKQFAPALSASDRLLRYDPVTRGYVAVSATETLPAGTVLWVHATTAQVLPVLGAYSPVNTYVLAAGAQYIANVNPAPWNLLADGPTNSVLWFYDEASTVWKGPSSASDSFLAPAAYLPPGDAAMIFSSSARTIVRPSDPRALCYYHQDHLGSSSIITDASGAVIEENTFFPYGSPRARQSRDGKREPYGFEQKENDVESGLNHFVSRYQSPVYARFITTDNALIFEPTAHLGNPQALNFYAFCLDNPMAFHDPNGQNPLFVMAGAYLWNKGLTKMFPSLDRKEEAVKQAASNFAEDIKNLKVEVSDGGTTAKAKGDIMVGVWFGDKDVVSLFAEFPTSIASSGLMQTCAQAGLIALDGRVLVPFGKSCHVWSGQEDTKPQSAAYESKTKLTTRYDDRVYERELTPQNGGTQGIKATRGFDVKAIGKPPGLDSNGRLQWDMGVGIIAGGEFSANVGQYEATGKMHGSLRVMTKKVGDRVQITVQGVAYGEAAIVIKIPQAANMLQFPVRVSAEGSVQRTWSFSVDQIRAMRGL